MKNIIGTIGLASSTSALGGCETGPAAFQARRPGRRCSRLTVFSIPTSGAASSRKNSNSVGMPALNFCTGFSVGICRTIYDFFSTLHGGPVCHSEFAFPEGNCKEMLIFFAQE